MVGGGYSIIKKSLLYIINSIKISCIPKRPHPKQVSLLKLYKKNSYELKLEQINEIFKSSYSINNKFTIIHVTENNFKDQNVVLLAHFDTNNIISPYVQYLAKQFKLLEKKVILCSGNKNLSLDGDISFCDAILCRTCDGYDFTSWKTAFTAFPSLFSAKEITLCNDSVFGPIGSYKVVYKNMEKIKCDFWGLTLNRQRMPHLQSYHLVFRKSAILHNSFHKFIEAIPIINSREHAILLEITISIWLELHGLRPGCFFPYLINTNPTLLWDKLINYGVPILKRNLFQYQGRLVSMPEWANKIKKFNYESKLITNYFYRKGIDISPVLSTGIRSTTFPPSIFCKKLKKINDTGYLSSNLTLSAAVFIHCYYIDIFTQLVDNLKLLPPNTDFFISTDSQEKKNYIRCILENNNIKAKIYIFPNIGFDIAPFISGFKSIILKYDLILKIHTKKSTYKEESFSYKWRLLLYNSLLGSEEHINYIFNLMKNNHELGMLIPPSLPTFSIDCSSNVKLMNLLLRRMNLYIPKQEAIDFPAGSMFWARPASLIPLLELNLDFNDFKISDNQHRDGTLAHAIERLFLFSCCKAGFKWGRIAPSPYSFLK